MNTVISACTGSHQMIIRGRPGDSWRVRPERGEVLYPDVAEFCMFFRDGRHHSPAEAGRTA